MKPHLNTYQRRFAQHRIAFDTNLLSPELAQSLRRASLACAENQKEETGIIDFFCGLYLQDRNEITLHFSGDFAAVVSQNFPIHRFGPEGLVPKVMLDQVASEAESASLKDVVAASALDREWMDELLRSGLTPSRTVADFDKEVRTVIFHATSHTGEGWQTEMDFERDRAFQPPFMLEVSTPSGPFQPVRSAKVKLNGSELAGVSWPEKPTASVGVELRSLNKIEFELDGPAFGSVEVTVRGTPV